MFPHLNIHNSPLVIHIHQKKKIWQQKLQTGLYKISEVFTPSNFASCYNSLLFPKLSLTNFRLFVTFLVFKSMRLKSMAMLYTCIVIIKNVTCCGCIPN